MVIWDDDYDARDARGVRGYGKDFAGPGPYRHLKTRRNLYEFLPNNLFNMSDVVSTSSKLVLEP